MMENQTQLQNIAEEMANAIREWNRAKQERENYIPIIGKVPPMSMLFNARNANNMLEDSLRNYEKYVASLQKPLF